MSGYVRLVGVVVPLRDHFGLEPGSGIVSYGDLYHETGAGGHGDDGLDHGPLYDTCLDHPDVSDVFARCLGHVHHCDLCVSLGGGFGCDHACVFDFRAILSLFLSHQPHLDLPVSLHFLLVESSWRFLRLWVGLVVRVRGPLLPPLRP